MIADDANEVAVAVGSSAVSSVVCQRAGRADAPNRAPATAPVTAANVSVSPPIITAAVIDSSAVEAFNP